MAGYSAAKESEREKGMIFVSVDGFGGPAGGIKKVRDGILAASFVYPLRQLMAPGMAISRSHPRTGPRTLVGPALALTPAELRRESGIAELKLGEREGTFW